MWAIISNVVGVSLMIGSDVQKYTQLKLKKGLITDCFFSRTRNPNYLGEILIYLSFGIMSKNCISYYILGLVWSTLFLSSMLMKDLSFMKKDGWKQYEKQTLILLPRLFENYILNYICYFFVGVLIRWVYLRGGISSFLI